jgi:hypothetical protein
MTTCIYHGDIEPEDLARNLMAYYNRGNYQVQRYGSGDKLAVQIATRQNRRSGGQTALTANISKVEDGVSVTLSNQMWFGLAASLGLTAISALRNPLTLINRIDDIAQDVESLQLEEAIWDVINQTARQHGTGKRLSERLSRTVCPYCLTANPIASARCLACGAPLGEVQPTTCPHCGFVVSQNEKICPNCHRPLI